MKERERETERERERERCSPTNLAQDLADSSSVPGEEVCESPSVPSARSQDFLTYAEGLWEGRLGKS